MNFLKGILKAIGALVVLGIVFIVFAGYSGIKKSNQPKYYEENGKMYYTLYTAVSDPKKAYQKKEIVGADPLTFKVINSESTFHAGIINILSADKNSVFIQGDESEPVTKLIGADPETIKQVGGVWWLQDKNSVYLGGNKVAGADPVSFVEVNHPLYKDKNNVYLKNDILSGADAKSFSKMDGPYYSDISNLYYCNLTDTPPPTCIIMREADRSTFAVQKWSQNSKSRLDPDFAFDSSRVFYLGNIVPDADPKTFQKIGVGYDEFYRDANHTYKYSPETRAKIILEH